MQRWLGGAGEVAVGTGIELRHRPAVWLWIRIVGDVVGLGMLGTVLGSPGRQPSARRRTAIATAAVAGVTVAYLVAALRLSRLPQGARTEGSAIRPIAE